MYTKNKTNHPLRDFLPDGTEIRRVPDMTRTGNRPLYTTSNGVPFSRVFVKDKKSGLGHWMYREQVPTPLSPSNTSVNANRKQTYYVMPHHGAIYLHIAVCLAWSGPQPFDSKFGKGYECHHLNGITSDNRASNLIWLSHEEHLRFDAALRKGLVLERQDPNARMEYEMTHHMEI